MFDFAAAEKLANSDKPQALIAAIILGQSSAGKSYLAGTLPGKTLFLYTTGEEHGKDSARLATTKIKGAKIIPVPIDLADGKLLGFDSAYKRLLSTLDMDSLAKAEFDNVVLDGLTEVEQLIRSTSQWAQECRSKSGEHNPFAEPSATMKMLRPILEGLRNAQRELGINYYVTCQLMVSAMDADGEITASSPKLMGYEVAAQVIPQFPDQIMIGRMVNAAGEEKPRLQFKAKSTKVVKEKSGEIKKLIGFTPRLRGVSMEDLPDTMPADLGAVLKLKGG